MSERCERMNEAADERMAQCSTRLFLAPYLHMRRFEVPLIKHGREAHAAIKLFQDGLHEIHFLQRFFGNVDGRLMMLDGNDEEMLFDQSTLR